MKIGSFLRLAYSLHSHSLAITIVPVEDEGTRRDCVEVLHVAYLDSLASVTVATVICSTTVSLLSLLAPASV
jgi:hypothetical protein